MGNFARSMGILSQGIQRGLGQAKQSMNTSREANAAASRFETIGSDGANDFAKQLRSNPTVALQMAKDFGGMGAMFENMRSQAAFTRAKQAATMSGSGPAQQAAVAGAGAPGVQVSPTPLTPAEIIRKGIGQIRTPEGFDYFMKMAEALGTKPPSWVASIPWSRYTDESAGQFWDRGMTTNDWTGARKLLKVDPAADLPPGYEIGPSGQARRTPGTDPNPAATQVRRWEANIDNANNLAVGEGWTSPEDVRKAIKEGRIAPINSAHVQAINEFRKAAPWAGAGGGGTPEKTVHPAIQQFLDAEVSSMYGTLPETSASGSSGEPAGVKAAPRPTFLGFGD